AAGPAGDPALGRAPGHHLLVADERGGAGLSVFPGTRPGPDRRGPAVGGADPRLAARTTRGKAPPVRGGVRTVRVRCRPADLVGGVSQVLRGDRPALPPSDGRVQLVGGAYESLSQCRRDGGRRISDDY